MLLVCQSFNRFPNLGTLEKPNTRKDWQKIHYSIHSDILMKQISTIPLPYQESKDKFFSKCMNSLFKIKTIHFLNNISHSCFIILQKPTCSIRQLGPNSSPISAETEVSILWGPFLVDFMHLFSMEASSTYSSSLNKWWAKSLSLLIYRQ